MSTTTKKMKQVEHEHYFVQLGMMMGNHLPETIAGVIFCRRCGMSVSILVDQPPVTCDTETQANTLVTRRK